MPGLASQIWTGSRETSFGQQRGKALVKPLAGRLAKFRGEFQVMMSADGADMTKISGQMRQLGLHVRALGVPVLEH